MNSVSTFLRADSGAVTVDWTVLTAGLVGMGLAVMGVVTMGVEDLSRDTNDMLGQSITTLNRWGWNQLANAGFEDIEGMLAAGWGFYHADGTLAGWQNLADPRLEVHHSGYHGVTATGGFMMDLDASPGNVSLGQVVTDAIDGQTYTVSFDAADPRMTNGVEVWWGGELVGAVNPTGSTMQTYTFEVVGGAGDGSNLLMISGTGPQDNVGAYIDEVSVSR